MNSSLRVLVVDDEPLARARLRTLLADCRPPEAPPVVVAGEAADAVSAMAWLAHQVCDVVLLDIHMPGANGMQLAAALRERTPAPAVVFVTAHAEHAVQAFELEAVDYLTKPVRLERLVAALRKVQQKNQSGQATEVVSAEKFLVIHDRGRTERVPLGDVVYLRAELKYVTVRTRERHYIYDGSLTEFEDRDGGHWLRVHRNALVARQAVRALEKHHDPQEGGDGWAVRLTGVPETLSVSRRQLAAVRASLEGH